MKYEKSEARKMKYRALLWLRLDQRCAFIATEVGAWSADVIGANEKKLIEIEVKVTKEDLKNDFKKGKHHFYNGEDQGQWTPTHFYFMVPAALIQYAQELLVAMKKENYGLIDGDEMKIVRRAKWIHKRETASNVKFRIALRMGSELCRFHEAVL